MLGAVGAHDAYEEALKLEPTNAQAKSGLDAVQRAIDTEANSDGMDGDPTGGLGKMFSDPKLIEKLGNNPKTRNLLGDHEFMQKLQSLKNNPNAIGQYMQDQRFFTVMSVLLGIDMQFGGAPGEDGAAAGAGARATEAEEDVSMPDASRSTSQGRKAPEPDPEPEAEPEDEEVVAKKKAKEEADKEKAKGTELYKKRQFDEAIEHYNKAWDLHKDITYMTNLSAAKFEKGDYPGTIQACQQAVDYGREVLADFKLIAK